MRRRAERALTELGAAAPLGAVCLLVVNDHQWKRLFHNALTGKLSDVAICFLLPLLVSAALGLLSDWPGRRRLVVGAIVASLVFTLLELSDAAGALFVRATDALGLGGGALTRDPTDLLALACVPIAVAYGRRRLAAAERGPSVWRAATGALVMATGSLALMACVPCDCPGGPPELCNKVPAPVTFQAEAGCGPGGLSVIRSSGRYPYFDISNADALGLAPSLTTSSSCEWTYGYFLSGSGSGDGGVCPARWADGTWQFTVRQGVGADGKSLKDCDCSGGCGIVTLETCIAVLADGGGTLTCQPTDGGAPCVSHLTVVLDGGTD